MPPTFPAVRIAAALTLGALACLPGVANGAGTAFFMTSARDVDCTFAPTGAAGATLSCLSRPTSATVVLARTGRPTIGRAAAGAPTPDRRVLALGKRRRLGAGFTCAATRAGVRCRQNAGTFGFVASGRGIRVVSFRGGGTAAPTPSVPGPAAATYCCAGSVRWLAAVSDDGANLTLDDGSRWIVAAADRAMTVDWISTLDIAVARVGNGFRLTNTEDNEVVQAAYQGM